MFETSKERLEKCRLVKSDLKNTATTFKYKVKLWTTYKVSKNRKAFCAICEILAICSLFRYMILLEGMFLSTDVDLRIAAGEVMVLLLETAYDYDTVLLAIYVFYFSFFL